MAPQMSIPLPANILGLIGTVFWTIQLVPQLYHCWKSKSTEGLPSAMVLLWGLSALPFGTYAITQNFNIPLWIQPQFFGLFCISSWGQTRYYSSKWPARKAVLACTCILLAIAGGQVLLVLVLRGPYAQGKPWASGLLTFIGIIASIMVIVGYIEIPAELLKCRGRIVGISLLFLSIDWLGAFFSLMSLIAQDSFDITFGILYALVVAIEGSMFISHGIWLLRTRHLRDSAKNSNVPYDEFSDAITWQNKGVDVTFSTLWKSLVLRKQQHIVRSGDLPHVTDQITDHVPSVVATQTNPEGVAQTAP
ncbi:PQ loop repeat protein-like protein [Xylariaceae sp. FL0255]|nr:PQ loop repeat protein-like protein [Xylariaceae sp. FL0255]